MGILGERWGRVWPANWYTTTPGMVPDSAGQYIMSKAVVPTATECLKTDISLQETHDRLLRTRSWIPLSVSVWPLTWHL